MNEGRKGPPPGHGMKSRSKQRLTSGKKEPSVEQTPINECSQETASEAVSTLEERTETDNKIAEPENSDEALPVAPAEENLSEISDLEKALSESWEPPMHFAAILSEPEIKVLEQDNGGKLQILDSRLGAQPDGSCNFLVNVPEGYVDAVREWAESDGISVEQWLTNLLYSSITTYGNPPQGK